MDNVKKLPLRDFTRYCMSIAQVPSSYLSGLTMEEQLLWLCSFLTNEVIPTVNNNGEAVEELQQLYIQLKDYVDNYFDNLDIQEEVNTKLEEMAESGELTDIIAQYLQLAGVLAYDTKSAMKSAENLVDGSICKTLGNLAYSDGQGAFYKVREIQNTDVVDDVNIIALHNPDLIAEYIPYSNGYNMQVFLQDQINSINYDLDYETKGLKLNFQSLFTHDIGNQNRIQGITVDDNNIAYVYNENGYPNADLLKYDLSTNTYIGKIENLHLYHGNDLAYLNGKLWIASDKDDDYVSINKKICVYDLTTEQLTEIDPFIGETDYDDIWGISSFDENHLLCALDKTGFAWSDVGLFLLDIRDNTYTQIQITNPKGMKTDFYTYHQSLEFCNNKLYVTICAPSTILELNYVNNNFEMSKFYSIDNYDVFGQNFGEIQGITKIPSELFGEDTMLINTEICINPNYTYKTNKTYLFNAVTNLPEVNKTYWYQETSYANGRDNTNCDSTKTGNLYEDGTGTYPFKDLGRAINFVNNSKLANSTSIRCKGTLVLGYQGNKKFSLQASDDTAQFTIANANIRLVNCDIIIYNDTQNLININAGEFMLDHSKVTIYKALISTGTNSLQAFYDSVLRLFNAEINNSNTYAIDLAYGTVAYGNVNAYTQNNSKYWKVNGMSTLFLSGYLSESSKIERSGSSSVFNAGMYGY